MYMDYTVTHIPNKNYDLFGVKLFNGVTYCYWKNKKRSVITDIVVIPNNASVVNVLDGQICISLEGITNITDKENVIRTFLQEVGSVLNVNLIQFQFMVENMQQEKDVQQIVRDCQLKYLVKRMGNYQKEWELVASAGNEIKKDLVGVALDNRSRFVTEDAREDLDKSLEKPKASVTGEIREASGEKSARDSYLAQGYSNESTSLLENKGNSDEVVEIRDGGLDNQKEVSSLVNVSDVHSGSLENASKVVNESNNSGLYPSGMVDTSGNQSLKELKKYYKETDDNGMTVVYDEEGKKVTELDFNRYLIDENNHFIVDGQVVGVIDGELKELLAYRESSSQGKNKIYRREIDRNEVSLRSDDRAAFISLPVIIFIISFILLVISGIILFRMK